MALSQPTGGPQGTPTNASTGGAVVVTLVDDPAYAEAERKYRESLQELQAHRQSVKDSNRTTLLLFLTLACVAMTMFFVRACGNNNDKAKYEACLKFMENNPNRKDCPSIDGVTNETPSTFVGSAVQGAKSLVTDGETFAFNSEGDWSKLQEKLQELQTRKEATLTIKTGGLIANFCLHNGWASNTINPNCEKGTPNAFTIQNGEGVLHWRKP